VSGDRRNAALVRKCAACGTSNRVPAENLADTGRCGSCKGPIPPAADPIEADPELFDDVVQRAGVPVLVDFWAAWCGPCKMVAPEMEKLAAKYDGSVDVVKVDVDANPRLSQAFNIMSIPTIAFFKPGAQPQGVVGFRPLEQLEQQFGLTEFAVATAD